jgi:hypothetical protein
MRGTKIVETTGFAPQKLGSNFFHQEMVVPIKFYTLENVGNKLQILEKG